MAETVAISRKEFFFGLPVPFTKRKLQEGSRRDLTTKYSRVGGDQKAQVAVGAKELVVFTAGDAQPYSTKKVNGRRTLGFRTVIKLA